jgi:hypothetical protein
VTISAPVLIAFAGIATVAMLSFRQSAAQRANRQCLLDDCRALLDGGRIRHGHDGFPMLDGRFDGRLVRAELIPDSMTIRRLPQLWLSLTIIEPHNDTPDLGLLVRPTGTEFYALTPDFEDRLDPPSGLPDEITIRGKGSVAQKLLNMNGSLFGGILSDQRVKEIAMTAKGFRLVWQLSEGRRGEHLLLRQSIFDDARVPPEALARLLISLGGVSEVINAATEKSSS